MRGKCRVQRSSHCPPNTLPVFAPNVSFGIRFVYYISQTILFRKWLRHVRDPMSRARLVRRIERLAAGNAGDQCYLGGGLYELREHTGPGYRIYFTFRSKRLILLLAGGDKDSQERDINLARSMIERLENDA